MQELMNVHFTNKWWVFILPLILMTLDVITGYYNAWKNNEVSSSRMRNEKYEQELKVQKANQKIFELQRTNEQMGRLLSKIPPEVLEELQRTGKTRPKER